MTKNELTKAGSTALGTDVMDLLAENAGLGTETLSADDKVLAQLKIAQAMAPQLKKSDAKYVPGLAVGDLFNSATGEIYGPTVKLSVLGIYKALTIWPSLDDASMTPPEETVMQCVNPTRYSQIMAQAQRVDNLLVLDGTKRVNESFRIAAVVIKEDGTSDPVMIECAKTRYKNAKQLNTLLGSIRVTVGGKTIIPPSCAVMINAEPIEVNKDGKSWYEYKFTRVATHDALENGIFKGDILGFVLGEAKLLKENLLTGAVRMEAETDVVSADTISATATDVVSTDTISATATDADSVFDA